MSYYVNRAAQLGIHTWPQSELWTDVTLELLWQEYAERNSAVHYSSNHFCRLYNEYCSQTMPILDPHTGEILCKAQVFVVVPGESNFIFAEATRTQQLDY